MTRFISMTFIKTYGAWFLLPILSVFFGAMAAGANMLLIGLSVSAFLGIVLLEKPAWNTELVIILGLLAGLVPLYFDAVATKMVWGIAILGFMLLVAALFRLITTPKVIKSTPAFVWVAFIFFIFTIADSVLQYNSSQELIGGFKRYYQMWGLLFGLCWIDFKKEEIERWCKAVLIVCLIQVPFCLHQRIFLVPFREGLVDTHPGLEPIDVVAGTFGAQLYGGGSSADLATALVLVFAFLLARYREKILSVKKLIWISLLLLSPLFMGETKIIIIFFPLMFFVLYRKQMLSRPDYAIGALILGGVFMVAAINVSMIINKMSLDELLFDTLKYNVYEVGYGNCYLNRTTVLSFWSQHQNFSDPVSFLFGNGLGSAREGDTALDSGHIDVRYLGYCVGLTGVSMILWEFGIFGFILFSMIILLAWYCANRLMAQTTDPKIRADVAAIQACIALFAVYPLYIGSLLSDFGIQVMFTSILGYLAWLHKQHKDYKS